MCSHLQIRARAVLPLGSAAFLRLSACCCWRYFFGCVPARAQQAPAGRDGTRWKATIFRWKAEPPDRAASDRRPGLFVQRQRGDGAPGKARLTLAGGGQVDICGPAKFTLLESGGIDHSGAEFRARRMCSFPPATSSAHFHADDHRHAAGYWRSARAMLPRGWI